MNKKCGAARAKHGCQENLEIFTLTEQKSSASRRIDNFSAALVHEPYIVEKLSISWADILKFSCVGREKWKIER